MITERAIWTVLFTLGLPRHLCDDLIYLRWNGYRGTEKFEEIRHHEIQFHYPLIYRQRKYFD